MTGAGAAPSGPPGVLFVALDAADVDVVDELVAAGALPALADLHDRAAVVDTLAPRGLFVGAVWPTVTTAREVASHRYYTWLALDDDGYGTHQTHPTDIEGDPFWFALDAAGARCAVFDVPHALAARTPSGFGGAVVSEWGAHDRHDGPASHPAGLLAELEAVAGGRHFGAGPAPGFDQHAPCDYLERSGRHRTADEDASLLAHLLDGVDRKRTASLALLDRGGWDLYATVLGESHCVGHQQWSVHDLHHPRHDPAVRRRLGDPVEAVYRRLDATLAEHLERAGSGTAVFVLLSHGMGPHHDGTHLLDHLLLRFEHEAAGHHRPGRRTRLAGAVHDRLPPSARAPMARLVAPWVRRRIAVAPPAPPGITTDPEGLLVAERRDRAWFVVPNNTVTGAIRINVAGREPAGVVDPADYDRTCALLADRLRAVVDVDTGRPIVREVVRADEALGRRDGDGLPDLLVEWDPTAPIERVWSPHVGTLVAAYEHWRTGDHHRRGRLLVAAPGLVAGPRSGPISLAHVAPTMAAWLGVELSGVDGRPRPDLVPADGRAPSAVPMEAVA